MTTLNDHDRAVEAINTLARLANQIPGDVNRLGACLCLTDLRELVSRYIARPQAPKDAVLYSPEITISVDVAVSPWGRSWPIRTLRCARCARRRSRE